MNLHELYYTYLDRCAELEVIKKLQNTNFDYKELEKELKNSLEHQVVSQVRKFLKEGKENPFYQIIFHEYIFNLHYLPPINKLITYECILKESSFEESVLYIREDIYSSSDYIYLQECKKHFFNLAPRKREKVNIKYYGPVGTSGYAKICREICDKLQEDIHFFPIQFQNYVQTDDNLLLSSLVSDNEQDYQYIILHSTPDLWPVISKYERKRNPEVLIYGISVWETEEIPQDWTYYIQYVDKISTPSEFSSNSFRKYFNPVDTVYHPILEIEKKYKTDCCQIKEIKHNYDYIFYNISEWTNRKGLSELVKVYLQTFKEEKVLLYIKTFGDIKEDEAQTYIKKLKQEYQSDAQIILDYQKVSDSYIDCIHKCGDCYVSACKSEGHGIGACQALIYKNHVIITAYGGQKEYLELYNVDLVSYTLEPATFCTTWSSKHRNCQYLPHCIYFKSFVPSQHFWAHINEAELSQRMNTAYLEHKNNFDIHINSMHSDFREHLLRSLSTTTRKEMTIPITPKVSWISQNQILSFDSKKRILILSSSGYGNVGDDLYVEIFKHYFSKRSDSISFVPDYAVLDCDNNLIPSKIWNQKMKIKPFDFLIIGGGGLFNKERKYKNHSFFIYTDWALKNKIPYVLLSIGFQDLEIEQNKIEEYRDFFPIFQNASYISVRSIVDYSLVKSFLKPEKIYSLHYYPDLVYGLENIFQFKKKENRKYLVLVFSNFFSLRLKAIRVQIHKYLKQYSDLELIIMNWDGKNDNDSYVQKEYQLCQRYFKNFKFYQGLGIDFSFQDLFSLLLQTKIIIPGRFHSYVLAKVFSIPEICDFYYHNYKFLADKLSHPQKELATIPLEDIEKMIDSSRPITYDTWTEEERNNNIVRVHQKTDWDINLIQNFSNITLEEL